MIAFIDCGTTNTRVYLSSKGKIVAQGFKKVGVKNTAISGSNDQLREGIHDAVFDAISSFGCSVDDIKLFITSGMITSELGLLEIPHRIAPVDENDLAKAVIKIQDNSVFPFDIPIVFIPGIKNSIYGQNNRIDELRRIDFMRGEEVQVFGILHKYNPRLPANIIVIGSHTKLIHVDSLGRISGSFTTISGQFYESLIQGTFIGKCVLNDEMQNDQFSEEEILDAAAKTIYHGGLLRAMMMPRFMQVLMHTTSNERKYFINAAIVSEDMKIIDEAIEEGFNINTDYYLFGNEQLCAIYEKLIKQKIGPSFEIISITDKDEIRDITIRGALEIVKRSGVADGLL